MTSFTSPTPRALEIRADWLHASQRHVWGDEGTGFLVSILANCDRNCVTCLTIQLSPMWSRPYTMSKSTLKSKARYGKVAFYYCLVLFILTLLHFLLFLPSRRMEQLSTSSWRNTQLWRSLWVPIVIDRALTRRASDSCSRVREFKRGTHQHRCVCEVHSV